MTHPPERSSPATKRALVVNCYMDESRRPVARTHKIPQTIGPPFLAGGFAPDRWDIRLYNEQSDGPLEDPDLLGWPDLLVLTGLITSLDRMRHLTAYARTRNPDVVVVGGGHVTRALPRYCATFMDYVCLGDVEELRDVLRDVYGPGWATPDDEPVVPRFDLAPWLRRVGYAETSRNCNFACSFCTLTAEKRRYATYDEAWIRAQIRSLGRRRLICWADNNFYGSDRGSFRDRLDLSGALWEEGWYGGWGALVTSDFFYDPANVERAAARGCVALFTGVESFDPDWTASQNKKQNGVRPPVEIIRECLDAGIAFLYGLMFDLTTRSVADIRDEIELILGTPGITLPAYVSIPIPIPGTPHFFRCLDQDLILPHTKFRDLDGTTISLRTRDPLPDAARFVRELRSFTGYRARIMTKTLRLWRRYRTRLKGDALPVALANGPLIVAPLLATLPTRLGRRAAPRTHVSTTEPLDRLYEPAFRVDARFRDHFRPAMLTDAGGRLDEAVAEDLLAARPGGLVSIA